MVMPANLPVMVIAVIVPNRVPGWRGAAAAAP
jgi:hypothetical protein